MYDLLVNSQLIAVDRLTSYQKNNNVEIHEYNLTFDEINQIDICLKNKQDGDTKIDSDGKIVEDLLIIINKISIDHIDLTNKLSKISVYKDSKGQVYKTFNYVTFNGTYTIKLHKNLLYTEWLSSHL